MMIAISCAKLFASSFIVNSPHENRPIFAQPPGLAMFMPTPRQPICDLPRQTTGGRKKRRFTLNLKDKAVGSLYSEPPLSVRLRCDRSIFGVRRCVLKSYASTQG